MRSSIPLQNQQTQDWFQQPGLHSQRAAIRQRLQQLIGSPHESADPAIFIPSLDGRWSAWATTDPTTDLQIWRIQPHDGREVFAEQITDVYPTGIAWLPDGSGFYYDRFLPYPGGHGLYFHSVGTPQSQDACLLYRPEHPEWYYQPHVSPDGRWLAVSTLNGSACNLLGLIPPIRRTDSPTYTELISRFVGRYDILHWRDEELICRAVEPDALNGQLIAFNLSPLPDGPPTRRTLLPAGDLPLLDAVPLGDSLVASYLKRGRAELHLLDGQGKLQETVPLPGLGTVNWLEMVSEVGLLGKIQLLDGNYPDTVRLRFAYSDYARPAQIYTWQPGDTHALPEGEPPDLAFDLEDFVTHAHTATSADGTPVPFFLAHRRDVPPALCPAILTAYVGLGYSLTPRFSADVLAWMEMGGLFVSVCARGGGELGESWHQAGVGAHKQNTFDDVLAVAGWLLTARMTTPAQLGLWGVSNGGLTAGACLTQRPELFGAVVIESGLLDMLDYPRLGRGGDWLAEYGNPDDPAQRAVLVAYSPLHNIQPGTVYPATLITTSDDDPRVGEAHSLRFAERLQAAQTGTAPILLRVDPGGGHGDQPSRAQWLERTAHRLAFFAAHLGL
jgi:prolyl oligopeptidase